MQVLEYDIVLLFMYRFLLASVGMLVV